MWRFFIFLSIFFISCSEEDSSSTGSGNDSGGGEEGYDGDSKLYVCDQGNDKVYILNPLDLDTLSSIVINFSEEEEDSEQPHFIAIDEFNGYWFVSATQSGYVGMYDLETDALLDSIEVGNMPALLAVDDETQTLFVSRMMPMDGMMMSEDKLDRLDYSGGIFVEEEKVCLAPTEDFLEFPDPHAISFSNETSRPGGTLISASFTSDWLSRTDLYSWGGTQTVHQPFTEDNLTPDIPQDKLFPLAVAQKDDYAFFSCSGSNDADIKGQVQSWTMGDMSDPSLKSIYEFSSSSMLWHIVESPIASEVFVVLSGGEDVGIACLSYDNAEEFTDAGNSNGVYDEGEGFEDSNGNGIWDFSEDFIDALNGVYDEGEEFTDTLNGVYDEGEEFTDGNGIWDDAESFTDELNGVYDEGEEFVDSNGNDIYDEGEEFIDAGNGNALWDAGEGFEDSNGNNVYDEAEAFIDEGNGIYDEGETFEDTGNGIYDSDGVLNLVWDTTDSDFDELHGITASADGSYLYVSSRANGSVYMLDAMTGELLSSNMITGSMMLGGIAITQSE